MAKRRKKGGFFDPDYRKSGWRGSAFSPKNRIFNITQTSGIFAILISIPFFIHFYQNQDIQNLLIALAVFFVSWFCVALLIRFLVQVINKIAFWRR